VKVCIIIDAWYPVVGGGQVYVHELANRLVSQHNCSVDIYTRKLRSESTAVPVSTPKYIVHRLGWLTSFHNPFARVAFLIQAIWLLLWRRYDVLNPQSILPGIVGKIVGGLTRTPVILTVHGTALFRPQPTRLFPRLIRWVEFCILTRIKYTRQITVSENFRQLKNVNRHIVVIPNGVDLAPFDGPRVDKWKNPTLLYVGRFDPIKGIDVLIHAMALLQTKRPDVRLRLVGYGAEGEALRRLVHSLHLNEAVDFVGQLQGESLSKEYLAAHVFVLPSRSEGYPLTILEAWAARLPVVATDVGAVAEIISRSGGGIVVPSDRPDELANAIEQMLGTDRPYGVFGRRYVESEALWDKAVVSTYKIFQETVDAQP